MRRGMALGFLLACALGAAAQAPAGAAVPAPSLVAARGELTGFATATTRLRSAHTPYGYATYVLGERPSEARAEVARLRRKGFSEGVQELLSDPQGEALSFALVLGSARIASEELQVSRREEIHAQGAAVVQRLAVPSIPGAFAFTAVEAGRGVAAANVLFATGRCFLVVGDSLQGASREAAATAPLAGAVALYHRARRLCR